MNSESYFENEPWECAVEQVRTGCVGELAAVSVQAVCRTGESETTADEWQSRLEGLLGPPAHHDVQRSGGALSVLARHNGPVIVRMFFDESDGGPVHNFEIVGTKGLMIWKPDVRALSVLKTEQEFSISCDHPYATALRKEEEI
jgi:hypothetical protein